MTKPLKRHPALIPLSQDHHFGLLLCWKIRTGLKKGVNTERIKNYLNYFFMEHLENHFQMEEEILFGFLAKNDLLRKDAESQHQFLRKLHENIMDGNEAVDGDLIKFADELDNHIRFEERILFPYMQTELLEKELVDFKIKLDQVHVKVEEDWVDEFWAK
jgi:iron-sulfur cluster repair protein YtfE (RIC family)